MQSDSYVIRSAYTLLYALAVIVGYSSLARADYKILIDHTTTDLSQIPIAEIDSVKNNLHIAYNHTSHGSQLISGMNALENYSPFGDTYEWSDNGSSGLDLDDRGIPGIPDLSQGDYIDDYGVTPWVTATRNLLDDPANDHVNVIMWSWCNIGGHDIDRYLTNMEILISEYGEGGSKPRAATNPVTFVFMTGHANGGGENDSSDSRNRQIRQHCFDNERVLFDFADIENYDPNGAYYLDKRLTDDLDYDNTEPYDSGSRDGNWAIEYYDTNSGSELNSLTDLITSCAHSFDDPRKGLNCVLKGRASWWMFARINGWSGGYCTAAPSSLTAVADSVNGEITLTWDDNSSEEDSYIVQKQTNGGTWDTNYQVLAADSTTFTDSSLDPGTYNYRVVAHRNDDGNGDACDSSYSNSASGVIESQDPPDAAPTGLLLTVDHTERRITLRWTDNSSNEESFIIQRSLNGTDWNDNHDSMAANIENYEDQGLGAGTYSYRVVASNSHGISSPTNTESETIVAAPASPSDLTATGDAVNGTVQLSWTDNATDEKGFIIQRRVGSGTWDDTYDTVPTDSDSYLDDNKGTGPLPTGQYTYRIVAANDDILSTPSNESSVVISTSVPAAPSDIDSTVSGFDITVSWTDNSDNEDSFIIERNVNGGSWGALQTLGANTTSYVDEGLTPGYTYYYRVKAANSFGDSDYSATTSKCVCTDTLTLRLQTQEEVDDAFLSSGAPDTNYGSTRYTSVERYLIKFNLPEVLLNKRIVEARISFYGYRVSLPPGSDPQYLDLYRLTTAWQEMSVTWNSAETGMVWTTPGGDFATPDAARMEITQVDHDFFPPADITALVQEWVDNPVDNKGIIAINDSLATVSIKASEYSNDRRSYLDITYTVPIPGDVDGDGSVTLADTVASLQVVSNNIQTDVTVRGDINSDNTIGLAEAMYGLQVVAGIRP